MSVQTEIAQDAAFRAYFLPKQQEFQQQYAEVYDFYWKNAGRIDASQKGIEQAFTNDVQLPLQAGTGSFQYPEGVTFERDRFKAFPVEVVSSYEIDAPTYDDYRAQKKEVLASIEQDMMLWHKEFFKWQDILLAGDGSGAVGVLTTGSTTTVLNLATTPAGVHAKGNGVDILKKNVPYDLYNGATLSYANWKILSLDYANNQATLTAALGGAPASGLKIYPAGSRNLFPRGLRYGVMGQKDYWQGANCANKPEANSMVQDASGELIDNLHLERILQKQAYRDGGGVNKTFQFLCSPALKSLYKQPGWNMVQYQNGGGVYNTSMKDAKYEDSGFKPWRNLDSDVLIGNDVKNVKKVVQKDIGMYDYNGRIFDRAFGSNGRGEGRLFAQFGGRYNWYYENPQDSVIAYGFDVTNAVTKANFHATT